MGKREERSFKVRLSTGIWDDYWFKHILPDDKHRLLWLYLIAPTRPNKTGIIEIDPYEMKGKLGVSKKRLNQILQRFSDDGKIKKEGFFVLVLNFTKYQGYAGSALVGIEKDLEEVKMAAPSLVIAWKERYPGYTKGGSGKAPRVVPKEVPKGGGELTVNSKQLTGNNKEEPKQPSKKVKAKDIPIKPLAELEDQVPEEAFDAWLQWKQTCCESNKTKQMSESALAKKLNPILIAAEKEGLTTDALAYGFSAAANANEGEGIANSNWMLKAARSYKPRQKYNNPPPNDSYKSQIKPGS